jgi:hypothetical protein
LPRGAAAAYRNGQQNDAQQQTYSYPPKIPVNDVRWLAQFMRYALSQPGTSPVMRAPI